MPLTPRQQRFVEEYLIDLNGTAAARRAGYSEHTADRMAYENLRKPEISAALGEAMRARSERTQVTADDVVRELKAVAFSRMSEFAAWGPDGVTLLPSADIPADAARCVAEVSQTVSRGGGSLKFKLHSKTAALELLGRHLGMFKDVHEITFPRGLPVGPEDAEEGRRRVEEHRRQRLAHDSSTGANGHANGTSPGERPAG